MCEELEKTVRRYPHGEISALTLIKINVLTKLQEGLGRR